MNHAWGCVIDVDHVNWSCSARLPLALTSEEKKSPINRLGSQSHPIASQPHPPTNKHRCTSPVNVPGGAFSSDFLNARELGSQWECAASYRYAARRYR